MVKLNEMSISEITALVHELYSEKRAGEILSYPINEVIAVLEADEAVIKSEEAIHFFKHSPSRKKKAKRIRKKTPTKYKKSKDKKWEEKRRSNVSDEDVTNRAYLNKATKSYTKLHPNNTSKKRK